MSDSPPAAGPPTTDAGPPTPTAESPATTVAPPDAAGAPGERRRHAADAARALVALAILALLLGVSAALPQSTRSVAADLVRLFDHLPRVIVVALLGSVQVLAIAIPLAIAVVVILRRDLETLASAVGAALVAAATVAWIGRSLHDYVPKVVLGRQHAGSWVSGAAFPSAAYLAGAAAVAVVVGTALGPRWRRALWWVVGVFAVCRVLTATEVPINVSIALCLGVVAASAVMLAVGRVAVPITTAALGELLDRHGIPTTGLSASASRSRNAEAYDAVSADGESLRVKVFDTDERDRAFLMRTWQRLTTKGIDDTVRLRTARATAEREALAGALARGAGARAAEVVAVADAGPELAVLVERPVEGARLCDLDADRIADGLLADLWLQVGLLQRRRIAHRWLDATHVLVDDSGRVALSGFRWAETEADDHQLAADVSTLLTSTALLVGVDRATAAALAALGPERLAAAAPLLQPLALTPTVRAAAKEQPSVLADLREEVARRADVETVELARLARVGGRQVFGLLGLVLVAYLVISLASNASDIAKAFGDAQWGRIPVIVVLMFLGQFFGAVTLQGSTPAELPLIRTSQLMLAQGFLNRFTPANAGGMALRARFLQRKGEDLTSAAASVGLTSLASGAIQVVFIVGFALWAGRGDGLPAISLPSSTTVLIVLLVVLVAAGVVMATTWGRRVVLGRVRETARSLVATLSEVAHSPARVAQLFGGAMLSKLTLILMFTQSARAFGVGISFAELGFLYMVANTVASAAPTPGGVGAIEAALIAALVGVDVPSATALSVVLVFRVVSYWLPVPFGWWALGDLRRAELV